MSSIIACPNCGQKNRVDVSTANAICAKCWSKLNVVTTSVKPPPPPEKQSTQPPKANASQGSQQGHSGWVWVLVIVGVIWWLLSLDLSTPTRSTSLNTPSSTAKSRLLYPEVAMPMSGGTQMFSQQARIAPFEIKTSYGANYLVKLVEVNTGRAAMTIFVKGGDTVSTEVPMGTYEVKYASGDKWYGPEYLFGMDTSYSKADTKLSFEDRGGQISGYTITLYRVTNGNMRTKSITPEQF